MKRLFYKTVREDGSSVWAIGRFRRVYEIGKTYKFSKTYPAHIFLANEFGKLSYPNDWNKELPPVTESAGIDVDRIYKNRAEGGTNGGNRVLVCYGNVFTAKVPVYEVEENWDLSMKPQMKWRFVSDNFTVIGELCPTKRDDANTFDYKQFKVRN